eukprot:g12559.t1
MNQVSEFFRRKPKQSVKTIENYNPQDNVWSETVANTTFAAAFGAIEATTQQVPIIKNVYVVVQKYYQHKWIAKLNEDNKKYAKSRCTQLINIIAMSANLMQHEWHDRQELEQLITALESLFETIKDMLKICKTHDKVSKNKQVVRDILEKFDKVFQRQDKMIDQKIQSLMLVVGTFTYNQSKKITAIVKKNNELTNRIEAMETCNLKVTLQKKYGEKHTLLQACIQYCKFGPGEICEHKDAILFLSKYNINKFEKTDKESKLYYKTILDVILEYHKTDPHFETVRQLLEEKGAKTCFEVATGDVKHSVASILIEKYKKDYPKGTPFVVACQFGKLEDVKWLLANNPEVVNHLGKDSEGAEFTGLWVGHTDIVKLLLEQGADPNKKNKYGITPLHQAAREGHTEVCKLLLEKGADPNKAKNNGSTPLHWAAYDGHTEVAKLLLDKGADPNIANKWGLTPLHYAADKGHTEVVKLLLEKGADPNPVVTSFWVKGKTPLLIAIEHDKIDVVKLLLENGAEVNQAATSGFYKGWTPLYVAADEGHTELCKLLLKKGANPNKAKNNGWTPLYEAAYHGKLEIAKLLLEKGADPNIAETDGWTPLFWATINSRTEVATVLLDKGADPNIANNYGDTPLWLAAKEGKPEVVKLLLNKGADPNKKKKDGFTPLDKAKNDEIRKLLRAHGGKKKSEL